MRQCNECNECNGMGGWGSLDAMLGGYWPPGRPKLAIPMPPTDGFRS